MIHYTEQDLLLQFDDALDDTENRIEIGFCTWTASQVLKKMNRNDYMYMFNDWLDSMVDSGILYEHNEEYYDQNPMALITDTLKALKVAS
jgi:hypothetical protein